MNKRLISYVFKMMLPRMLKVQLNTARYIASKHSAHLGVVEIQDGDNKFILISKSDFDSWFGGNDNV